MKSEDTYLKGIPKEGFLKIGFSNQTRLTSNERIALIRKGNELLNTGKIEAAKRIFITTRYGDGLTRLGDYYWKQQNPLEALRMYWMAPAPQKRQQLVEKLAGVVRSWITEEGLGKNERITTGRNVPGGRNF